MSITLAAEWRSVCSPAGERLYTDRAFTYGSRDDTALTARLDWLHTYPGGSYRHIRGDALGVRR
jgi:hypothetical protein